MFRNATDNDIAELRILWRKCFEADSDFLNLFFGKGYRLARTYILEADSHIASALSVFPIKYKGHDGGYVYGVSTHPEHRGHRYAVSLLRQVENTLLDKELDFMILRPASPTLFDYYKKQGYNTILYRNKEKIRLPLIPAETSLKPLSREMMYDARAEQCRNGILFEWSHEMCGYILDYIQYCKGKAYSLEYGDDYIICCPDTENSCNIICEESGDIIHGHHNAVPYWIKSIYPEACTASIPTLSDSKVEEHMLCKTKLNLFSAQHPLFTFTME